MPRAALLLREEASTSLTTLVEKAQKRKPPLIEYDLRLDNNQLELSVTKQEHTSPDEGFESDIDSLSIVSSDGSFTTKTAETDSANGSAGSDSDASETITAEPILQECLAKESFNLVECLCYADVKFPEILVFVIKTEALVFKFDDLNVLRSFYLNFSALKAVTNQKVFNKNSSGAKFNLLQRTDNNGVTHIEITREPEASAFALQTPSRDGQSSIISLNTNLERDQKRKPIDSRQRTTHKSLSSSTENILVTENSLRKVWNSAEDLLVNTPRRPERRKKPKGRAPQPPAPPQADLIVKSQAMLKERKPTFVALLTPPKPCWTNSVPRLLKKQRSKSETRHFTPMAYRYVDTTPTYSQIGDRFFGLSPKIRDFTVEQKWGSKSGEASNLKSVIKKEDNNKKKSCEKKVTFSAYTTVQVV